MIHKTAIIDSNAKISQNVTIGPYSVIGPKCRNWRWNSYSISCKYNR